MLRIEVQGLFRQVSTRQMSTVIEEDTQYIYGDEVNRKEDS